MFSMMVVLVGVAVGFSPPAVSANANLRTLRTFQTGACDGDDLLIECWPNTVISISKALYGRPIQTDSRCPVASPQNGNPSTEHSRISNCTVVQPVKAVEEICKDKVECTFKPSPSFFKQDPCPGVTKYAEVLYKCRPSTLYTKIVCEGERLRIRCPKTLRIVIYNAWFGSTLAGVPECPQQKRHKSEDCHSEYATETVMDICHGRLKCSLAADTDTFEKPGCTKRAHLFLKVVYTCVSKDILQDLQLEDDSVDYSDIFEGSEMPVGRHGHQERDGGYIIPTLPGHRSDDLLDLGVTTAKEADILSDENASDVSTDVNCTNEKEQKVIGFITEWIAAYKFISDNKEKFILYLTVSLGAGLLLFLIVLAVRLYVEQQRQLKAAKLNISEPIPLSLDEDCSDMDHYDPRHDRSVEVVRYTNTSTVRRQDSNSGPRAPLSHSMNNYYYS